MDQSELSAKVWEAYETCGLITACAWCRRVCIEGEWLGPIPGILSTIDTRMTLSHSICPRCVEVQRTPESRGEVTNVKPAHPLLGD